MISFIEQVQTYASYHKDSTTRYIHMLGIPLILLSLMILFGFVHIVILGVIDVNLSEIATLALLVYYVRLQWRVALATLPILVFLLWISEFFSYEGPTSFALWSFFIILLLGCTLQMIGFFVEGKRPPVIDALWQLLVAPLILAAEILFSLRLMRGLKEEVYGKVPEKI